MTAAPNEEQAFINQTTSAIVERDGFLQALRRIASPIPPAKGLSPTERANRLRRLIEQRRMIAIDALSEAGYS